MLLFGIMLLILLFIPFCAMWVSFLTPKITWENPQLFTNFIIVNFIYAFAIAIVFGGLLR
ncbi:hypothetical protein D3C81_519860 [compost metagenome]